MALPTLTSEQRQQALAKAGEAREARKRLLTSIKVGDESVAAALERASTDSVVGKTRVAQLLKAQPGWGDKRVASALDGLGIPRNRRAGGLGNRQRESLLDAVR